jgi:hypothetical protein
MQGNHNNASLVLLLHHSGGTVKVAMLQGEANVVAVGSTAATPERQLGRGVMASRVVWTQPIYSWKPGVRLRFTLAAEVVLFALELQ